MVACYMVAGGLCNIVIVMFRSLIFPVTYVISLIVLCNFHAVNLEVY